MSGISVELYDLAWSQKSLHRVSVEDIESV